MAYGSFRALYATALDRLFAVVGSAVYEIFSDKTHILRGYINSSVGNVSIAENESQLILVDGENGYIYDLRLNTITPIVNQKDMVEAITVDNKGTGYKVGDVLTLVGGSANATIELTSVTGGVIDELGYVLLTAGRGYTTGIKTTTGGSGTGATFTVDSLVDGGFIAGSYVVTLDGFFVVNEPNSGRFRWSYLRDGLTWDVLSYATAEGSPDNLQAINKVNNELWLFGTKTTEVWYDTGNNESQFQRIQQGFIDIGIAAANSSAVLGNQIFWLGQDTQGTGVVWTAVNLVPKRISTHAIEYIIAKIAKESSIADASGYCYQQEGHFYYVLNFTAGNRTLVYDTQSQLWHERGYWNSSKHVMERHLAQYVVFCFGKTIAADYRNSRLYVLDLDTYTDAGNPIRRIRTGPHIRQDRKRLFFREFEVDIERGVGTEHDGVAGAQGTEPFLTLTHSDDGGRTFGSDRKLTIGRLGTTFTRAHAHRLGYSRDRVFRLTISDPVKIVLLGARADIEIEGEK